jgi:3'(2'), 5'-bisphosphate nucleotidase
VILILNSAMSECVFARVLAASVALSRHAGEIVRQVRLSDSLDIVDKGKQDFQTKADRECQRIIVGSLLHHFPGLRIIGEEDDIETSTASTLKDLVFDSDVMAYKFPEKLSSVEQNQIIAWVDPLDGTKEYTEGGEWLEHVTVLIGLSVNGVPLGGVIHQPFYQYLSNKDTKGRTVWGAVGLGAFGAESDPTPLQADQPVYTTTRSHSSPVVNECLAAFEPCTVKRLGGAGHKVLAVLDKRVHAYIYPSLGCKKWDTCAPEAILRAAGGYLTDIEGHDYTYTGDEERMNWMGELAGFGDVTQLVNKVPQAVTDKVRQTMEQKIAARK